MIKNILFDMDGTLVNCTQLQTYILREVFQHFDVDTTAMDMSKLIGPPLANTFAQYFGAENVGNAFDVYKNLYLNTAIHSVFLMPGIAELLSTLHSQGYRLFVTSLQIQSVVQKELEHLGVLHYFERVCGDNVDKPYSSKGQIISQLFSDLGLDPAQSILVGDTNTDLLGGRECGLQTIGVMWGYGYYAFDKQQRTINTPQELITLLPKL